MNLRLPFKSTLCISIFVMTIIPYASASSFVQCPSSASFTHAGSSEKWIWNQPYPDWGANFQGSENSSLKVLPGELQLTVKVDLAFRHVFCDYGNIQQKENNSLKYFSVQSLKPVRNMPNTLPDQFKKQSYGIYDYECKTQASTPEQCAW